MSKEKILIVEIRDYFSGIFLDKEKYKKGKMYVIVNADTGAVYNSGIKSLRKVRAIIKRTYKESIVVN
jgi:hypothetical protein